MKQDVLTVSAAIKSLIKSNSEAAAGYEWIALFKDGQQNCHVNVTITNVSMIVAKCQLVLLHTYMFNKKNQGHSIC